MLFALIIDIYIYLIYIYNIYILYIYSVFLIQCPAWYHNSCHGHAGMPCGQDNDRRCTCCDGANTAAAICFLDEASQRLVHPISKERNGKPLYLFNVPTSTSSRSQVVTVKACKSSRSLWLARSAEEANRWASMLKVSGNPGVSVRGVRGVTPGCPV